MNNSEPISRDALIQELKELIISALNIDDIKPSDIGDNDPLFGEGLVLDSIDALEIVVSLERKYSIKIGSSEESKKALESVATLADLIISEQSEA